MAGGSAFSESERFELLITKSCSWQATCSTTATNLPVKESSTFASAEPETTAVGRLVGVEDRRAGEVVDLAAVVCVELDRVRRDEVRDHVQEDRLGRDRVFARELRGLALVDDFQVFRHQHLRDSAAAVDHLLYLRERRPP